MNVVTADSAMQSILGELTQPTEIRAASGEVLGYFTPLAGQVQSVDASESDRARRYEEARSHFDPQELKRRKASNEQGVTTAELLAKLERIVRPGCGT